MSSSEDQDTPTGTQTPSSDVLVTSSLKDLQTDEQRQVLDTVAQIRKCGLDGILSLPQLVVCGDQSAGKSSVLEALTEIPFPRNDNLCTRYATEIILRRSPIDTLTIKVIPDTARCTAEQEKIKLFVEKITDFGDLPRVMKLATDVMGISGMDGSANSKSAFAKDTLSIEIEGPSRPQLTLVDIPGLIQTSTKGVSDADVDMVADITEKYISQPRTICLAVVSATNDAANQPILRKVRVFDPAGDRTLGIITKPDRLPAGSGMEAKFLELARNEDVEFRLGWHVLKNRSFEQGDCTLEERNFAESTFFSTSNFKSLPADNVGIDALRTRLSQLLFQHVKQELPKLRQDLENTLEDTKKKVAVLGSSRADVSGCRAYLAKLSLEYWELCTAAVNGHYEHAYFQTKVNGPWDLESDTTIARLRAVVQHLNTAFSETIRIKGHKFVIDLGDTTMVSEVKSKPGIPKKLSKADALKWVRQILIQTRGKELIGNFNPLLVGALFWEQSSGWKELAIGHVENVSRICDRFLDHLLNEKASKDVKSRLWASMIGVELKARRQAAIHELELIMEDLESFPINYNHYYTDTINKRRLERQKTALERACKAGIETKMIRCDDYNHCDGVPSEVINVEHVIESFNQSANPNMEDFSCEEALDCLLAIYKVQQKTFIANVATQVIERHIVRGLNKIFSPVVVTMMTDLEVEAIASEPPSMQRHRLFLEDKIKMLEEGHDIFKDVLSGTRK